MNGPFLLLPSCPYKSNSSVGSRLSWGKIPKKTAKKSVFFCLAWTESIFLRESKLERKYVAILKAFSAVESKKILNLSSRV